jgi:hypothetical protein
MRRVLLGLLTAIALVGATAWGALALQYSEIVPPAFRTGLAAAFAIVGILALIGLVVRRIRVQTLGSFTVAFGLVLLGWSSIRPSNDRDWQPDVAVLPYATFVGDLVTVHNIRNATYRSEADFTPAYYDKTFDLRMLDEVDLITSYWMGPSIAHVFLSFGFSGKDYLAISIETRKEVGESYSTIAGFFRQYELYYVVADERDVVRVRTNYRKDPPEDVYLYRVRGPRGNARRLFLDYMREINALKERPEFYNTLTTNCTTSILMHTRVNPGHLRFSWKILASGYVPEYAYEAGRLDTSLPFEELRRRSHINEAAHAADAAPDFSQRIRAGLPMPAPMDAVP